MKLPFELLYDCYNLDIIGILHIGKYKDYSEYIAKDKIIYMNDLSNDINIV